MREAALLAALAGAVVAGCLGTPQSLTPPDETSAIPSVPILSPVVSFAPPLQLTGDIGGFEPSIRAGPEGNVYAAAAKTTRPNAGPRLADWAWSSSDDGATWHDLPMGPGEVGALMPGLEGDLAVDGSGRVYYADTHLADDVLHRWSVGADRMPAWDFSRPVVPTFDVLDDRPYMAAHGDGVVYLVSNNGVDPPAPQNILQDPVSLETRGARIWIFASQDAGLTWSLGWGFPGETFCAPAAARADDITVTVACHRGAGQAAAMTVYRSSDRAGTFDAVWATNYTNGPGYLTPWPAADEAGWTYVSWLDERVDWSGLNDVAWGGSARGRVMLARNADGVAWERLDITPFAGRFGMGHVSAWPAGVVAVTFHGTTDLEPGDATAWYGYALVSPDARAAEPVWHLALLDPRPTATGPIPPRDFFQNAVGPDGRVHAILEHVRDATPEEGQPASGIHADVLYVGQSEGPNLRAVPAAR